MLDDVENKKDFLEMVSEPREWEEGKKEHGNAVKLINIRAN